MEYTPTPFLENLFPILTILVAIPGFALVLLVATLTYFYRMNRKTGIFLITLTLILGFGSLIAMLTLTAASKIHTQQQVADFINKLENHYQIIIPETTIQEWFPHPGREYSFEKAAQSPPVTTNLTYNNKTYITDLLLREPEPGIWELYGGDGLIGELVPVTELLETTN